MSLTLSSSCWGGVDVRVPLGWGSQLSLGHPGAGQPLHPRPDSQIPAYHLHPWLHLRTAEPTGANELSVMRNYPG